MEQAEAENAASGSIAEPSRAESRTTLLLIALFLLAAVLYQVNSRLLFDPDEGRNAEVMREMAQSHDFVVPHLNGLPFLDKPFLYFAAGGLVVHLLGATETAVRVPAILCTLGTLLLTWLFARRWLGRRSGALAALALATTPIFLAYSQIVIFDAMLTLWITAAALACYRAVEAAPEERPALWAWLAWAAIGLGVLTKGPVALLVPLAATIPWAIWRRRLRRLWAGAAPLALLPTVGPWVWAVLREDAGFLDYVLFTETLGRMSGDALNRDAPIWYYVPFLLFGALPWSLVPIAGWREVRRGWQEKEPTLRFLLAWLAIPLLLFSLLHSKRPHYILPLLPALALLSMWTWRRSAGGRPLPGARAGALLWLGLGMLLVILGAGGAADRIRSLERFDTQVVSLALVALGAAWVVAASIAWLGRRSPGWALLGFALPVVALVFVSAPLLESVGEDRSAHRIAHAIEAAQPAGGEVIGIETWPPSLSFYLGRTITLISADGDPLRSNYLLGRYRDLVDHSAALRSPAWLSRILPECDTNRLFLVERRREATHALLLRHGHHVLAETPRLRLYGGCVSESRAAAPAGKGPKRAGAPT